MTIVVTLSIAENNTFDIASLYGFEAISSCCYFELNSYCHDINKVTLGQYGRINICSEKSNQTFHGIITQVNTIRRKHHQSYYRVTLRSTLWLLKKPIYPAIYDDLTVNEMITSLLSRHHINHHIQIQDNRIRQRWVNQGENELIFLKQILADNELIFYIEQSLDTEKVIISNNHSQYEQPLTRYHRFNGSDYYREEIKDHNNPFPQNTFTSLRPEPCTLLNKHFQINIPWDKNHRPLESSLTARTLLPRHNITQGTHFLNSKPTPGLCYFLNNDPNQAIWLGTFMQHSTLPTGISTNQHQLNGFTPQKNQALAIISGGRFCINAENITRLQSHNHSGYATDNGNIIIQCENHLTIKGEREIVLKTQKSTIIIDQNGITIEANLVALN